jgi:D-aspartate ligase
MNRGFKLPISAPSNRGACSVEAGAVAAKISAVVVGANANGLGIVRSLAKGGVPVITVDDDRWRPGMHSRYTRAHVVGGMSGLPLVDGLLALRAQLHQRPVLFLTYDYHVNTVSEHWDQLKTAFCMRLPGRRSVCELLHKTDFQRIAERHGFPVPRAVAIRNEQDLANLSRIRFPAVIKP